MEQPQWDEQDKKWKRYLSSFERPESGVLTLTALEFAKLFLTNLRLFRGVVDELPFWSRLHREGPIEWYYPDGSAIRTPPDQKWRDLVVRQPIVPFLVELGEERARSAGCDLRASWEALDGARRILEDYGEVSREILQVALPSGGYEPAEYAGKAVFVLADPIPDGDEGE